MQGKVGKYLVQTRSQAKSSGICLPEVYGIDKGLDPNILPGKHVIKPTVTSEGTSQIKPRFGQGRVGLKWKIKIPIPLLVNKTIVKVTEKPIEQPKENAKDPRPESSTIHDKIIPIQDYTIPQTRSSDDSSSRMVKRKKT